MERLQLLPDQGGGNVAARHGEQAHAVAQGVQRPDNVIRNAGNGGVHPEKGVVDGVIGNGKLPDLHGCFRVHQAGNENLSHKVHPFCLEFVPRARYFCTGMGIFAFFSIIADFACGR